MFHYQSIVLYFHQIIGRDWKNGNNWRHLPIWRGGRHAKAYEIAPTHYPLRCPFGDSECKKNAKVTDCFSLIFHPTLQNIFCLAQQWPDCAQKKNQKHFRRQNLSAILKNSQKGRRGPQRKLKLCMVKKGIMSSKKAQNSDFRWGPLHGENGLLK